MKVKIAIHYTLLGASVVFFVYQIIFNYHVGNNIQAFPDSNDYIFQSEQALFSSDFISPTPSEYFSPRPFTVPLLYKIVGSKASNIVILQKIMYCISILSLMFSLINFIDNYLLKLFSAIILLYFFSWWNIVGWSNIVLSESLSLSFFFLWIANILLHYKNRSILSFCCLIGISILLSFPEIPGYTSFVYSL